MLRNTRLRPTSELLFRDGLRCLQPFTGRVEIVVFLSLAILRLKRTTTSTSTFAHTSTICMLGLRPEMTINLGEKNYTFHGDKRVGMESNLPHQIVPPGVLRLAKFA